MPRIAALLVFAFCAVVARADYLYTVTDPYLSPPFPTTVFTFTEPTLAASGDVTSLTYVSGFGASEFSWNSAAGGSCPGGPIPFPSESFSGFACEATTISTIGQWAYFPAGSFLSVGSYSFGGITVVTISSTPEPSGLVLLASGALAMLGTIRRKAGNRREQREPAWR